MQFRTLGKKSLNLSAIGLGCMGMSDFYAGRDDEQSIRTIHHALDCGVTFIDTADMYGPHTNELLVGRALQEWNAGKRDQLVISTKFGIVRDPAKPSFRAYDSSPAYVKQACEASLKRLGIDAIDLYFQHRVDPNTPIEQTVLAMVDLMKAGKIRHIGLSEASPETIRRAAKVATITALQSEFSLWTRDYESTHLPLLRELGIGFVAYAPLGRGFLTGKIKHIADIPEGDFRRSTPRFQEGNFQENLNLVARIEALAKSKGGGCTPAQLALAWVLAQGPDIVPIVGTKRIHYLDENLATLAVTLSPEELGQLDAIAPLNAASGERYPASAMSTINR